MNDNRKVVLVVDDEPLLRWAAVEALANAGFEVLEAANAAEAIELLAKRVDIRVVFTDVQMPGDMDGITLALAIRDRWPPVELVVTSGVRVPRETDLPARSKFLPKPYSERALVETIRALAA